MGELQTRGGEMRCYPEALGAMLYLNNNPAVTPCTAVAFHRWGNTYI